MIAAEPCYSKTLIDSLRDLLSFKLADDIFSSVNEGIVGKLQAKNVKFILPNKIEIDDLEVLDELGDRVLYGKHVKLAISLISLLTNNITISDAYVDAPFFRYTVKNNVHNVVRVFQSPPQLASKARTTTSKMRVTIEKVSVDNGSYEMYHDAGVRIFAEGISAAGTFWVEKGPFGVDIRQVNIDKGSILAGGMDLPISHLVAKSLWISDEKVSTNDLVAFYEKAKVTGRGTVFIGEARYDLSATIDAPTGTYPKGLKPLPFVAPSFNARVEMAGGLTEPEFLAELNIGSTDFNGLTINGGNLSAQINRHQVMVKSSKLRVGEMGTVWANGVIDIDHGKYHFLSRQKDIFGHELAKFLSLDRKTRGSIEADSKFDGSFSGPDQTFQIASKGKIADGAVDEIAFADETSFDVDLNLILDKKVVIKKAKISDGLGLKLAFSGALNLTDKSLKFGFDLFCPRVSHYLSLPAKTDAIDGLAAKGGLVLDSGVLTLSSLVKVSEANFAKVGATKIKSKVDLKGSRLSISDLSATFYQGTLTANVVIDDFQTQKKLHGDAAVEGINLLPLSQRLGLSNIEGRLSSSFNIGGNIDLPSIGFLSEADDLVIGRIKIKKAQIEGQFAQNQLKISRMSSATKAGTLDAENLSYDVATKKIAGILSIADLDIASTLSRYVDRINGYLDGPIHIEGTLESPLITAPLTVKKLSVFGVKMGDGAVTLALARRPLLGQANEEDLVFSISANLGGQNSTSMARFSVALNKKTINADIDLDKLEMNTAELALGDSLFGITGRVSGKISAEGPINSPIMNASLSASEYGFFDPSKPEAVVNLKKIHGPALLYANIGDGKLKADLCVSLSDATGAQICDRNTALSLALAGPFNLDAFSLDVAGAINHTHLEEVIFALKNELVTLDLAASVNGNLTKTKGEAVSYKGKIQIDKLSANLPNIPSIELDGPVSLAFTNRKLEFVNDAVVVFAPGQLTIGGSYAASAIDLHLQGAIPLVLTRLFVPIIQRADGLASGSITISGSSEAPIIEGSVIPQRGSTFVFRKWLEPIEVREGMITFERTSSRSFSSKFDKIKLAIGDGKLSLNGTFDKQYSRDSVEGSSTFNLELHGSNIVLRERLNFIETDFNIRTEQSKDGFSMAKGEVIITDGSAHRQFDLRNFVAQAQSGLKPGISKVFDTIDMQMDLDIAVRQFRASARMLNLDIEAILRGQMTASGPISHPKFKGALFVNEGAIIFPSMSFDLVESQIVLDENSARAFDPKIEIVATQELEKDDYGEQISQDTTIELTLRGDMDRLNLELRPLRGDLRLSQLKIFLLLLSPRSVAGFDSEDQGELLKRGAQNAAMAFTGEVFLRPLTNELQELLESKTKTRIQFGSALEPGGLTLRVNWKLGPRIELQGSYMFDAWSPSGDKSFLMMDSYHTLGDLKLKLLLFDHRPIGPLSLETSFGSVRQQEGKYEPRGKIRLKYRVLSK